MDNMVTTLFMQKFFPLLGGIFGFGILVAVHECGHFLFAKLFGIHAPTFSIGFGPQIYKKKIGGTEFCLSLLPLGGYVEIAGMEEIGQGEQNFAHDTSHISFRQKPYWQKFLVLLGGILFNMLFAYFVYVGLHFFGRPTSHFKEYVVRAVAEDSPAQAAGLLQGDRVIGINEKYFDKESSFSFSRFLSENPGAKATLQVIREEENVQVPLIIGERSEGEQKVGFIGIEFMPIREIVYEKGKGFLTAFQEGWNSLKEQILSVGRAFQYIFFRKGGLSQAGGPVAIIAETISSAREGFSIYFFFLAFLSVNLALVNLLPIGVLDGGKLFMVTIESLIRRPLPHMFTYVVDVASLLGLFLLVIILTYQDVLRIFFR